MTYLVPPALKPLAVQAGADGAPRRFQWSGQAHAVESVLNRWRVHDTWWSAPLWRDYFAVLTTTGWLAVLYHDLEADAWLLERVQD